MNEKSRSDSYAAAGVDITAGYKAVELMKTHIARTVLQGGSEDIGGFGGLFELDITDMPHPVLVSGTDGVGTKLKLAFLMDKHDTVGIDCVAMCVNDIICCGAKPLFFLDYIACGKNFPEKSPRSFPVSRKAACRQAVSSSAAKPRKCRAFTAWTSTTWQDFRWALSIRRRCLTKRRCAREML